MCVFINKLVNCYNMEKGPILLPSCYGCCTHLLNSGIKSNLTSSKSINKSEQIASLWVLYPGDVFIVFVGLIVYRRTNALTNMIVDMGVTESKRQCTTQIQ